MDNTIKKVASTSQFTTFIHGIHHYKPGKNDERETMLQYKGTKEKKKHKDDDAIEHKCFYMKQHEQKQWQKL